MGEAGRVSTAGAVAYQRHPLLVRLFSETEVARGNDGGHCHRHGAGGVGMKIEHSQKMAFDKSEAPIYIQLHLNYFTFKLMMKQWPVVKYVILDY